MSQTAFEEVIFPWVEYLAIVKGQRPRGVAQYEKVVRAFVAWLRAKGHAVDPQGVSRQMVTDWLKDLFYEQGNVANSSRASKLSAVRSFFAWCKAEGYRPDDPTAKIPSPKVLPHLPQKFSTEELRLLFAAPRRDTAQGVRDLAMLYTMYAAGPRVFELVSLNVNSVVDTGGYIRLQILGKGGKERTITLRTRASRVLRQWLILRREIPADHAGLFVRLKGPPTRLTDKSAQNILKKYARIVGIDESEVFVHKMRATFASDLYDSGHDNCPRCNARIVSIGLVEVAIQLGHEDPKTSMGYIAVSERTLRKLAIPDRRFSEIEEDCERDPNGKPGGSDQFV